MKAEPQVDLYAVLGVSSDADPGKIKCAHRAKVRGSHPDLNPGERGSTVATQRLNHARDVLLDETKRAAYDASRTPIAEPEPAPKPRRRRHRTRVRREASRTARRRRTEQEKAEQFVAGLEVIFESAEAIDVDHDGRKRPSIVMTAAVKQRRERNPAIELSQLGYRIGEWLGRQ